MTIVSNYNYKNCEISGSEKGVPCTTYKGFFYSNNQLLFNISEMFENIEDYYTNDTIVNYNFTEIDSDTTYQISIYYQENPEYFYKQFEKIDKIQAHEIEYKDVLKYNVNGMTNLIEGNYSEAKFVTNLYFKLGIGLIAFNTMDDLLYVRKK